MRNSTRRQFWLRLCAVCAFVVDVGGLTADALNGSAAPIEASSTPTGAPYVLFEHPGGDHPVWDCSEPIGVAVNLRKIPSAKQGSLVADLVAAIEDIDEHSAFRLTLLGSTDAVPTTRWATEWHRHSPAAQVVVTFGDATDTDLFEPGAAAMGGLFSRRTPTGDPRAHAGFVYVHTAYLGDYGPGRGHMSRVGLFTHELLHVLGLGHVHPSYADSIMTPSMSSSHGRLGSGDKAGLLRLSELGCPESLP